LSLFDISTFEIKSQKHKHLKIHLT